MAVTNYSMGQLDPIVYFQNREGEIWLPPSTQQALAVKDQMRARGFELKEANSLDKIDRLQKELQDWEYRKKERDCERLDTLRAEVRRGVRDRLVAKMVSSSTTPYERDFIQAYLMLSDDKRDHFRKRFMCDNIAYFEKRESDNPYHFQDMLSVTAPDQRDTECDRCHRFRRIKGSKLCMRCAAEMGEEIQRQG